jgi:glucans biosynthesis protein
VSGAAGGDVGEPSRCGAKLRSGGSCDLSPVPGRRRCFQHGGAQGIGAPAGNRNAWKDGFYGRTEKARRRQVNAFIRDCLRTLKEIEGR